MTKSSYSVMANVPQPRQRYASDSTDKEWAIILPYLAQGPDPGRKRHILVDTLGLLMALVVHAANIQDYDGARQVLQKAPQKSSRLQKSAG